MLNDLFELFDIISGNNVPITLRTNSGEEESFRISEEDVVDVEVKGSLSGGDRELLIHVDDQSRRISLMDDHVQANILTINVRSDSANVVLNRTNEDVEGRIESALTNLGVQIAEPEVEQDTPSVTSALEQARDALRTAGVSPTNEEASTVLTVAAEREKSGLVRA